MPGACGGFLDGDGYPYCRGAHIRRVEPDSGQYDAPAEVFWYSGRVPILQTLFLTVIVLSVERAIALKSAKGTGNIAKFVAAVGRKLAKTTSPVLRNSAASRKVALPLLFPQPSFATKRWTRTPF